MTVNEMKKDALERLKQIEKTISENLQALQIYDDELENESDYKDYRQMMETLMFSYSMLCSSNMMVEDKSNWCKSPLEEDFGKDRYRFIAINHEDMRKEFERILKLYE